MGSGRLTEDTCEALSAFLAQVYPHAALRPEQPRREVIARSHVLPPRP